MKTRVVLYARIRRCHGEEDLELQLARLREYAGERGWTVVGEYVDFPCGAGFQQPALEEILRQARAGRFNAVLVVRINKIARSISNLQKIAQELRQSGVDLVCIDQGIDTTKPSGKLLLTALDIVSQFELEFARDRTLDGLAEAKRMGKKLGRPRLPVSTEEIRRLREEGLTLKQIAERVGMSCTGLKKRLRTDRDTKGVQEGR